MAEYDSLIFKYSKSYINCREQKPTSSNVEEKTGPNEPTLEGSLEQAKRAFALKNYELSVEHYAAALEIMYVK